MIPKRLERIAEEIHKGIAVVIGRSVKDPRVLRATITRIKVSPDLKRAVIHFSVIGDASAKKDALEGFQHARSFIRKELGHYLKLRWTPDLRFYYDDSIEDAIRMTQTLSRLKEEREGTLEADREHDPE